MVVKVGIAAPPKNDRFGALVAEPAVVPKTKVLATPIRVTKLPVPDKVNPVASAIERTVVAATVDDNVILVLPKAIALALVPVEAKIPVLNENPFSVNVPPVNVTVLVLPVVRSPPRLKVPPIPLKLSG